jgi:predicted hydrocarbon binding protein
MEGQVERLFVTSLQRAIEEHAPEEMEVVSEWFDRTDRKPRFHVATVIGAVGYLRRKPSLYEKVIQSAGHAASEHAFRELNSFERRLLDTLPRFGRERLVKYLLHTGLRCIHRDAQLAVARERGKLILTVGNSMFCHTRADGEGDRRCHFYSALFAGLLEKTDLNCFSVEETECRGQGADACRFEALLERPQVA